ncbi:tetratricopeptide repeat protein [Methylocystis bryophila]|nr:hypothetical protein [Methylocystis bryophila]
MNEIKAFVGHSFTADDKDVVDRFTAIFNEIEKLHPSFSWVHAESAESSGIDEKVLALFSEKNVFIGICTKRECVVPIDFSLKDHILSRLTNNTPTWKTSDWIIQEIGLAIGLGYKLILLVESGVRLPGGLQGSVEYIPFERAAPERSFTKLAQMISSIAPSKMVVESVAAQSANESEPAATPPSNSDWKTPKPEWRLQDYQFAFRGALVFGDKAAEIDLDKKYLATAEVNEDENRTKWVAFREYERILFGTNGSIQVLKQLSESNPTCAAVFEYLAKSFLEFRQFSDASKYFKIASDLVMDQKSKARLFGDSIVMLAKAKAESSEISVAVEKLKEYICENEIDKYELFVVMRRLAEVNRQSYEEIAYMQLMLECDPSDTKTRFLLAFEHAQLGNDELAVYHYNMIPFADRNPITWNNLGVAFDKIKLPAMSVDAYRMARKSGETLAMSNLAFKFLSAGFLAEAKEVIDDAMKRTEIHGNIPRALTLLKEQEANESKLLEEIIERSAKVNAFLINYGYAIFRKPARSMEGSWKDINCELRISILGKSLSAEGRYQKSINAFGLGGLVVPGLIHPAPETWIVEYVGTVHGSAVEAMQYTYKDGDQPSLLSRASTGRKTFLILSENEMEFQCMIDLNEQVKSFSRISRIS